MRRRYWVAGIVLLGIVAAASGSEKLDRGFVALERKDGSVFLSWRMLENDSLDSVFRLTRSIEGSDDLERQLVSDRTNVVDEPASGRGLP